VQKRTEKDIWQNLYEFYLIETDAPQTAEVVFKDKALKKLVSKFIGFLI
jgi:hypothetical protein